MKVLSVASEIYPFVKTGGLADVTGALPKALKKQGVETFTMVPGYPALLDRVRRGEPLLKFHALLGESAVVWAHRNEHADLLVLDIPALYDRPGGPYLDASGADHHDNWKRFAALSLAAARVAEGCLPEWKPDIVQTHDWQSAMTSVYMRQLGCTTPVVLTIHNIAFQGQSGPDLLPYLHLPHSEYSIEGLEYYNTISFLKGGIMTSDVITTVSPTYAREILTPEFGMGMQDILNLKGNRLRGILNGIDDEVWNPASDPHIVANYTAEKLGDKARNRRALARSFGLHDDGGPIFAAVSRLSWQKGIDMLLDVTDEIIDRGGKLVVCGKGDRDLEQALIAKAASNPGRMAVHVGYSEDIAHYIHAGADAMIQPSRFEPCGLTQLYALRYGTVPIVSRTGGLAETIIDANDAAVEAAAATGFQFHPVTVDGLRNAVRRAFDAYGNRKGWRQLQKQGMAARFSWERSARLYAEIYDELTGRIFDDQRQDEPSRQVA